MQAGQWTTETIIFTLLLVFTGVAIGYLLAAMRQGRKISQLAAQLEQSQQAQAIAVSQQAGLQGELKEVEARNHELQVKEGMLQAQLNSARVTEERLTADLKEGKERYVVLEGKLEQLNQQRHAAEMQNETSQTEVRNLKEQVKDYCTRLDKEQVALQQERLVVSGLKDALAEEGKKARGFEAADKEARAQLQDLKVQLVSAGEKHDAVQAQLHALKNQHTQLKTEADERQASHAREVANFEQQKASLSEQFKLLSNEILEAKTKSLQESSKLSLSAVMSPFQQSIDSFKKEVQEIHHRETTQQGELRKELEQLKALNQQITTEAHELSTALRGQKKLQGNWGELVLENVLDRSGLQLGKDYQREVSITTEAGRQRPDVIVYLPQGRHLIIDAKVSLNAYTRFVNAEDETERAQALKEHVHAVGSRIKELAQRDYYKLPGLNSPDMVFMFIPIESAFVEALKADETLFQQAIENNVLVATPTTLLTSLNIVRQLWRYEDQNKHTAALAHRAEGVFKKLNSFLGSFDKIRKGLEAATEAYVTAEGQLVSGKGNLVKQIGDFKNLAPAIKAKLPAYFVDKAALEIDFIPADQLISTFTDDAEPEESQTETESDTETN